jgi:hypothetical protein
MLDSAQCLRWRRGPQVISFLLFRRLIVVMNLYPMEQSSWGVDSLLPGQEIPRLLWNRRIQYSVHKRLPLQPVSRQLNSSIPSQTISIKCNSIFPFHPLLCLPSDPFPVVPVFFYFQFSGSDQDQIPKFWILTTGLEYTGLWVRYRPLALTWKMNKTMKKGVKLTGETSFVLNLLYAVALRTVSKVMFV